MSTVEGSLEPSINTTIGTVNYIIFKQHIDVHIVKRMISNEIWMKAQGTLNMFMKHQARHKEMRRFYWNLNEHTLKSEPFNEISVTRKGHLNTSITHLWRLNIN